MNNSQTQGMGIHKPPIPSKGGVIKIFNKEFVVICDRGGKKVLAQKGCTHTPLWWTRSSLIGMKKDADYDYRKVIQRLINNIEEYVGEETVKLWTEAEQLTSAKSFNDKK